MLTGVDGIEDRVNALDAGADDYRVNPSRSRSCWTGCGPCKRRHCNSCQLAASRNVGWKQGRCEGRVRNDGQQILRQISADPVDRGRRSGDTAGIQPTDP